MKIIDQPEQYEVPRSPVRDDSMRSEHEDLDRMPDGVPHDVIGLTFGFSIMLALLVAFMMAWGGTTTRVASILLAVVAIPVIVKSLNRRAARERDHVHPSR